MVSACDNTSLIAIKKIVLWFVEAQLLLGNYIFRTETNKQLLNQVSIVFVCRGNQLIIIERLIIFMRL